MKTLYEQIDCHCVHFSGLSNATCKVGVNYQSLRDKERKGYAQYPCWREGADLSCDQRRFPTPAEVQAKVDAIEQSFERSNAAVRVCREDAQRRGFKKGNGGAAEIGCPVCRTGMLHYSVAGYNGHLHGRCDMPGCVSWMQ